MASGKYLSENLPVPGKQRIYFDYGTETLDSTYEPYQEKTDELMEKEGYRSGNDWKTEKFEGADHPGRS